MENHEMPQENTTLSPRLIKLSKFLALLLVHRSMRFPIPIDEEGYASLQQVLHILKGLPNFRWAGRGDVETLINTPGRRRFEIDDQGTRIRARPRHEIPESTED
ncbi:MAG: RNA 2'-phosphotransferase [Anaerolineae bacterium]|nr:RNA 2'-phosphotransferase [Anaerolineae bacterium]